MPQQLFIAGSLQHNRVNYPHYRRCSLEFPGIGEVADVQGSFLHFFFASLCYTLVWLECVYCVLGSFYPLLKAKHRTTTSRKVEAWDMLNWPTAKQEVGFGGKLFHMLICEGNVLIAFAGKACRDSLYIAHS